MRFCGAPSSTELNRTIILLPKHRTLQWTDSSTAQPSIHAINRSIPITSRLHGLIALISTETPPDSRLSQYNHHYPPPIPSLNTNASTCNRTQFNPIHLRRPNQHLARRSDSNITINIDTTCRLPFPLSSPVQPSRFYHKPRLPT